MSELSTLVSSHFLGNSALSWAGAGGVAALASLGLWAARRLVRRTSARLVATERREFIELPLQILSRTTAVFLIVVALYVGLATLELPPRMRGALTSAITIAAFWQVGVWLSAAVQAWIERKRTEPSAQDRATLGSLGVIGFIARVVIWAMALLLTLDNLGVNITALVAGLGIGGIAIALAVQNVLGDLLASLSITLDKPFVVGDFLIVGEFLGSVEYIGVKSTRLRSLTGEQIVMSNADLLTSRVRNYGRMYERRVVFTLDVAFQTPRSALRKIAEVLRSIVEEQEGTRFDRSHFAKYAAASLQFETVYHVLSPDYNRYMDIQEAINFRIHEEFERLGVEFAYPTQKLWLARALSAQDRQETAHPAQSSRHELQSA